MLKLIPPKQIEPAIIKKEGIKQIFRLIILPISTRGCSEPIADVSI